MDGWCTKGISRFSVQVFIRFFVLLDSAVSGKYSDGIVIISINMMKKSGADYYSVVPVVTTFPLVNSATCGTHLES